MCKSTLKKNLICFVSFLWQAVGRHESLIGQNMEKKAQWKEELMKEKEAAITLSEKAQ